MKQRSVRFNFLMNFILTASSLVFPLITHPYVSRVLMPEGMGKAEFAVSVISYFTMLAMLGIPTYGIRACAQVRDDKEALSKTVQELMIINVVMAAVCYVLLAAAIPLVPRFRAMKLLLWVTSTSILLNAIGVNWFYSAIEEYAYITVRSLIFKVISIVVMFLFVRSPENVVAYAVVLLIASYGSYVLNFLRLRKYITFRRFEHYSFLPHIKVALIFFAMSVATTIYTNLDVVMLGFMKGDAEVGYYYTAVRVKQILVSLVTSLGTVLLPRLSYYVQSGEREEFYKILHKAIRFVLFAAVPLTVFFMLCARETVLILSGEAFLPSVPGMRIIMPTVLLIGLTNILGIQLMIPLGQEKKVTLSVAAGGVVDLILNALLIPSMGASGAALGTLAAELTVLIVQLWMTRDTLRALPRVSVWRILAAAAMGAGAALPVQAYMSVPVSVPWLLVKLMLEAAAFGAAYLAVSLAVREPLLQEEIIGRLRQMLGR